MSYREGVVDDTDESSSESEDSVSKCEFDTIRSKGQTKTPTEVTSVSSSSDSDSDHFSNNVKNRRTGARPLVIISSDEESEEIDQKSENNENVPTYMGTLTQDLSVQELPSTTKPNASSLDVLDLTNHMSTLNVEDTNQNNSISGSFEHESNCREDCIDNVFKSKTSPTLQSLELSLDKLQKASNPLYTKNLPDKGAKLFNLITETEQKISQEKQRIVEEKSPEVQPAVKRSVFDIKASLSSEVNAPWTSLGDPSKKESTVFNKNLNEKLYGLATASHNSRRVNDGDRMEFRSKLRDTLANIYESLKTCPKEGDFLETPEGLNINLMHHQKYALAWLVWRESQEPSGGILADDMGLGKTLSMLSLILQDLNDHSIVKNKQEVLWFQAKQDEFVQSNGTLIICPASLIGHWEGEIKERINKNGLRLLLYHGTNRNKSSNYLAKYDIVLTTYNLVAKEVSPPKGRRVVESVSNLEDARNERSAGLQTILNVAWRRIILDEGHVIRNPKSQTSRAVCMLRAKSRWVITGTPVHNRELDMYSLLRFLRCSPFDELYVWKNWVDNKSAAGMERMNVLMKSLLLRRLKDQVDLNTGLPLVSLPSKEIHIHTVDLSDQERSVYEEVLKFSKSCLLEYMKQHQEREANPFAKKHLEDSVPSVNTVDLLVLLLRLRQICSHPALIESMLNKDDFKDYEQDEEGGGDHSEELVQQMSGLAIDPSTIDKKLNKKLHICNPVFDDEHFSTKLEKLFQTVKDVCDRKEKVVVVSQWVGMLTILSKHLQREGIKVCSITGSVDVRDRGAIVDKFNKSSKYSVMLLSLTAGGVGLNLIGANHLILSDIHWNPQLEFQASDRVHRMGQTRDVHIHKYICANTVEEKIQLLQEKKVQMADNILSGTRHRGRNKLTLQDLQMLFEVNPTVKH